MESQRISIRVRMKPNLIALFQSCPEFKYSMNGPLCGRNEMLAVKEMHGYLEYFKLKLFLKSIEGRVVNLIFIGDDAFEKTNDNYWLPDFLWIRL